MSAMTDHLKAAYQRYTQGNDHFIAPISKVDAEIINELMNIFEKLGVITITEILKEYKLNDDKEILTLLKDAKKQVKPGSTKDSKELVDETLLPRFLEANGMRIDLRLIFGYNALEFYSPEGRMVYAIILNPTPENAKQVPFYSNTMLSFKTIQEHEYCIMLMDEYFTATRGLFINDLETLEDNDETE